MFAGGELVVLGCFWDIQEEGCVFLAGLNKPALFSCEAHNSKGLTASSPGLVNIKGQLPYPVKPPVSKSPRIPALILHKLREILASIL